jgi:hypothetical protein
MPASGNTRASFASAVLPVWLVTAAWDFVCASALSALAYHTPVVRLWQGVATTALGTAAIEAGPVGAVAAGLALHLAVAFTWSAIFVGVARRWPTLRNALRTPTGALAVATAYGPLIWFVMSLVVIPLATGRPPRLGVRWWVQVFAHIPFVTLPLVYAARRVQGLSSEAVASAVVRTA